jgi:peptidoglycan/LPS O-acetylase OafA/YrhL
MMNVSWSLMVEWLVNIAYAAIGFRLRTRTLAILAIAGWFGMAIAGYHNDAGWCVGMSRTDCFSLGLLRGFPSFFAGVVLYRLHDRGWFARLPVIAPELLLTFWLCIAAVPTFGATPTFDWITVTLLCPLLMLLLLRADGKAPSFCRGLGELSYPLYTVHPGIILLAHATPLFGLDHGPNPMRAFLVVGLCIAAAWMVSALSRLRPLPWRREATA